MMKENNFMNLSLLAEQIERNKEKKKRQSIIDKQYYKPHFGPEETDEKLLRHQ